jgi:hypothetical protein
VKSHLLQILVVVVNIQVRTVKSVVKKGSARAAGGLAYITPTVNGLHAGVAGYATAHGTDKFDATDIAVFYPIVC